MQSGLLSQNAYMVQTKSKSVDWIIDYYKDKGIDVTVDRVEDVAGAFAIYSVREK